jgi:uncharacterized protein YyaL (SSP411 family)
MINNVNETIKDRVTDYFLWLNNSHNYSQKFFEIAVSGNNAIKKAEEIMEEYLPNALIAASKSESKLYLLKEKHFNDETYIYVCVDNTCKVPVTTVSKALILIND